MLIRVLLAFLLIWPAALAAYLIGAIASSQFVMNAYEVEITASERLSMTLYDATHMWAYAVIIGLGFCIAFPIAALLKRLLPGLAGVAYPLAGAVAIAAALGLMYSVFATIPISGARSALGMGVQVLAGAVGGYVFAQLLAGFSGRAA